MPHSFDSQVRALSVGFALAALGTANAVHAQTSLYVDASAPAGGDGQSWATAFRDLQDALSLADHRPDWHVAVQIKVAQGIYTPDSGTLSRDASFVMNSGVSLLGGFAGLTGTNPDQDDPARFVSALSGDLRRDDDPDIASRADNSKAVVTVGNTSGFIQGFTIRGGVSALNQTGAGHLDLSFCTITDNYSSESNNVLSSESPAVVALRTASVWRCVIADNSSTQFPIVSAIDCSLSECVIAGNSCIAAAGPTYVLTPISLGDSAILITCLIAANVSSGFGPYCAGSQVSLYNCTIADNQASRGAGCFAGSTSTSLTNCIVSRNTSTGGSGGRQVEATEFISLASCFLDHGAADIDANGGFVSSTGTLSGDPHFLNPSGPDGNPLAWRDNDYSLAPNSPCIDHANSSPSFYAVGYTDLLGHAPTDDPSHANLGLGPISYLDIGAYEFIPNPCRADFNESGAISPQDIFDFLSAWFALSPAADFNLSGSVTPQDIFDFLNAWFAGC